MLWLADVVVYFIFCFFCSENIFSGLLRKHTICVCPSLRQGVRVMGGSIWLFKYQCLWEFKWSYSKLLEASSPHILGDLVSQFMQFPVALAQVWMSHLHQNAQTLHYILFNLLFFFSIYIHLLFLLASAFWSLALSILYGRGEGELGVGKFDGDTRTVLCSASGDSSWLNVALNE